MPQPGLLFIQGPAKQTVENEPLSYIYYVCIYYDYSFMEMISYNVMLSAAEI